MRILLVLVAGAAVPMTQPSCVQCLADCSDGAFIDVDTGADKLALAGGTVQVCRDADCRTVPLDDNGDVNHQATGFSVVSLSSGPSLHFDVTFNERPTSNSDDIAIDVSDRGGQLVRHYEWTATYRDSEVCGNTCRTATLDVSDSR